MAMVNKEVEGVRMIGVDMTPVVETGRRAWWAYLGAIGMAQDEIVHLTSRMVERGTMTEKESRKLINELMALPQQGVKSIEAELQKQIEVVLERLGVLRRADIENMNLPTRADIQVLSEKVAALSKKVDQLRKMEEPQAEKTEALAGKVQTLSRKVTELKKTVEEEGAQAGNTEVIAQRAEVAEEKAEALAGKVQTLNRKVTQLQKTVKEETAPEPEKAKK